MSSKTKTEYCNCTKNDSWWNQIEDGKICYDCKKRIRYEKTTPNLINVSGKPIEFICPCCGTQAHRKPQNLYAKNGLCKENGIF